MSDALIIDGVAQENVLARDRGLHYGDGLFETMALRDGRVRHWDRHMQRLARGARALGIEVPDEAVLRRQLGDLATPEACVVKLIVTRGDGRRGYAPDPQAPSRCLWRVEPWPEPAPALYERGARVAWLATTLARQSALAGIKHLSRLEQVLAARELAALEADEGLLCDARGDVIEAVSANVFVVHGERLSTPSLAHCGVAGILREAVLDAAREAGIDTAVTTLRRADFALADEVFLTNSVRGLVPVAQVGDVVYTRRNLCTTLGAQFGGPKDGGTP